MLEPPHRDAEKPECHVIVVGCGLGGLAAAIAIKRSGHRVTVLERMVELREIGAGIQIPPNACKILKEWGIFDAVKSYASQPHAAILRSYRDSTVLSKTELGSTIDDEARSLDISILLSSNITDIDLHKPSIQLSNRTYESDIILGADGERSMCREAIFGHSQPPHDSGDQVFRITVKSSEVLQHKDLVDLVEPPNINLWMGPDANALTYLLKQDGLLNIAITRAHKIFDQIQYGPQKATINELLAAFDQWDPKFRTLFNIAQDFSKWTLLEADETPHWTAGGNFALLGDAAHAMLPYLAQGAAQAFEDAAVLGVLFSKLQHKSQLSDLLRIYEGVRKPRTTQIRNRSAAMRNVYAMKDGPLQQERDRQLLGLQKGSPNPFADPAFQKWLFGYDAMQEAVKAWEFYLRGEESLAKNT